MNILFLIAENFSSSVIIFFIIGIIAGILKLNFKFLDKLGPYLSIYLMLSIGFKGGFAIATMQDYSSQVFLAIGAGILISFLLPFIAYKLLRLTTNLDSVTAAAVAAHYGSISVVTYATCVAFLKTNNIQFSGYIVAILALMEAPAILSGFYIAHINDKKNANKLSIKLFANNALLALFSAFFVGWLIDVPSTMQYNNFFDIAFRIVLSLFLLDMGYMVAKNMHYIRKFTWQLTAFGIYMPIIGAIIGLFTSYLIGLNIGTGTLLITLCASASYIAVPAAMRLALPKANAAVYVPLSLAITFPFNVTLGIPLYLALAELMLKN